MSVEKINQLKKHQAAGKMGICEAAYLPSYHGHADGKISDSEKTGSNHPTKSDGLKSKWFFAGCPAYNHIVLRFFQIAD